MSMRKQCSKCHKTYHIKYFAHERSGNETVNCSGCREIKSSRYVKRGYKNKIVHVFVEGVECKKCTKCEEILELSKFYKKTDQMAKGTDGLHSACKVCTNDRSGLTKKQKEERKENGKIYREKNKAKIAARNKKYVADNKEAVRARQNKYKRERRKNDPNFKLDNNLRGRVYNALHSQKLIKSRKTFDLIGCSVSFLKSYLAERFVDGMSWDNYGKEWEIDHIKPVSKFDLSDKEEQLKCFHYFNLQPLWRKDNRNKRAKWTEEDETIWAQFTMEGLELFAFEDVYILFSL